MILNPGEYFTVARELADPNDSGTYYVQAKIRNARTGVLLKTLNLTDQSGQRFTSNYQVPQDTSGLGFYITVSTRVYTDSGYTALSDSYDQESDTYLVDNRFRTLGGGGYGGDDTNYKKIRQILREELKTIPETNLTPVLEAIKNVITVVRKGFAVVSNKLDEPDEKVENQIDLSPILSAIAAIPPSEKADLSPVMRELEAVKSALEIQILEKFSENAKTVLEIIQSSPFKDVLARMPDLEKKVSEISGNVQGVLEIVKPKAAIIKPDYTAMAKVMIGRARTRT